MKLGLITLISTSYALAAYQDTLYMYQNRTVFTHLRDNGTDTLLEIPFDKMYQSGDILVNQLSTPANNDCKLLATSDSLYAFCPSLKISNQTMLQVQQYDSIYDDWNDIQVPSNISYFANTSYIYSRSDPNAVYMFSGIDTNTSSLSNRMLRLDLESFKFSNAITSVQPNPFQQATSLEINANTEILFGGLSDSSYANVDEIPVWQYNGWAERPCESTSEKSITGVLNPLLLPVFETSNEFVFNETTNNFQVSSVLALGGTDIDGEPLTTNIASLNVSSYVWEWNDLSDQLSNSTGNGTTLNLENAYGIVSLYDTLLVINEGTKRSQEFTISLFNADTFKEVDSVNYSQLQSEHNDNSHAVNKSLIIALSVIIPILVVIIASCLGFFYYRKYKQRKEQEMNEKEVAAIVDFYENQHKQFSTSSFGTDSTYKGSRESLPISANDVIINNFDDGDNISFNRPQSSSSLSSAIFRTLSKTLPPIPKHIYMNHNPNHNSDYSYPPLNHIPENSSISTFQTSSTSTKRDSYISYLTPRTHRSNTSKSKSISSNEDMFSQTSPSKTTKSGSFSYQQSNKSDGSLDDSAYNSSVINMMRRMNSKRKSNKLRITNPDVIQEHPDELNDNVSLLDMNYSINPINHTNDLLFETNKGYQFDDPFADMNSNLYRSDSTLYNSKYYLDPFTDMKSDIFRGDSILKHSADLDPFSDMKSDIFRGNTILKKHNDLDPFADMRSDIFRGDSILRRFNSKYGRNNMFRSESILKSTNDIDPFAEMQSDIFRGDSILKKVNNDTKSEIFRNKTISQKGKQEEPEPETENLSEHQELQQNIINENDKRCVSSGSSTFGIESLEEQVRQRTVS